MLFKSTIVALLAAVASAKPSALKGSAMIPDFNVPTDSKMGRNLLAKARRLEQNQNNNQNQNQDNQEADWLAGYSIKYDSCSSIIQLREEGGNDEEGLLYSMNMVKFTVCPGAKAGCQSCGSGVAQYVVPMSEFVQTYVQMKEEEQEQACEMAKENCYCENANDDQACENQCLAEAGLDDCIEYEQENNGQYQQEEVDIAQFMECAAMEGADGNQNQNNGQNQYYNQGQSNNKNGVDMYRQYYVGARCSPQDGKSIHLAAFYDAGCTSYAGKGIYEAFNYGYPLPYESESIIATNECISCLQVDQDQNNNQNGNYNYNNGNNGNNQNNNYNYQQEQEVAEICQQSYQEAAKCESSKLSNYLGSYYYPDQSGCEYINTILPNLAHATRKIASGASVVPGGNASTAFAVIFGLTTALLGAYAFFLYRKIHRAKVNLAQAEMNAY